MAKRTRKKAAKKSGGRTGSLGFEAKLWAKNHDSAEIARQLWRHALHLR